MTLDDVLTADVLLVVALAAAFLIVVVAGVSELRRVLVRRKPETDGR